MKGAAKIMNGCRRPHRLVQILSLATPTKIGISDEKMPSPPMAKPMSVPLAGLPLSMGSRMTGRYMVTKERAAAKPRVGRVRTSIDRTLIFSPLVTRTHSRRSFPPTWS